MPGSFTITDVCDRLKQHSLVIHTNVVKKAIEIGLPQSHWL